MSPEYGVSALPLTTRRFWPSLFSTRLLFAFQPKGAFDSIRLQFRLGLEDPRRPVSGAASWPTRATATGVATPIAIASRRPQSIDLAVDFRRSWRPAPARL